MTGRLHLWIEISFLEGQFAEIDLAQNKLDAAVYVAYYWDAIITDDDLLARVLARNSERGAAQNP